MHIWETVDQWAICMKWIIVVIVIGFKRIVVTVVVVIWLEGIGAVVGIVMWCKRIVVVVVVIVVSYFRHVIVTGIALSPVITGRVGKTKGGRRQSAQLPRMSGLKSEKNDRV